MVRKFNRTANDKKLNEEEKNEKLIKINSKILKNNISLKKELNFSGIESRILNDERECQPFFKKFKRQNTNKKISSILDKDGILLTEQRDINKYISQSFEDKFSAEEPHFDTHKFEDFMSKYNIILPQINS